MLGSSNSSAAAIDGLLAQLRANILALKATEPSHFDKAQLESAKVASYLLTRFMAGVESQQEAIRNPPPAETPLNFDDMVHTLSFLDCKSLAAAAVVSRHWCRAAPEAVKFRLNHLSGTYCGFEFFGNDWELRSPTAQLLAQVEREFKEAPALIQQLNLSKTSSELERTKDDLLEVDTHVMRLHSNLIWEKVRQVGWDASETKDAFRLREKLFNILRHARLPVDELAPHASCVVDALRPSGDASASEIPRYCLNAMGIMNHMPAAVIEKHIDSLMLLLKEAGDEDGDFFIQSDALEVIAKLAPETLALLNLKAQIAAAPLAKSQRRSEREQVVKLLKSIPC